MDEWISMDGWMDGWMDGVWTGNFSFFFFFFSHPIWVPIGHDV
jgi:hypothetical protein